MKKSFSGKFFLEIKFDEKKGKLRVREKRQQAEETEYTLKMV